MLIDGAAVTADIERECDVVVVGTGAGGAVVGKELSERGLSVIFLEEGGWHAPCGPDELASEAVSRMYRNRGLTLAFGNCAFPVPQGRGVGGTTAINMGTSLRIPRALHERWVNELGLKSLSEESLAPHYQAIERELGVAPAPFERMGRSNLLFHRMLEKEGQAGRPLSRNAPHCRGCGLCTYGCPSRAKHSTEVSCIPKAIERGASLYTSCKAVGVLRSGRIIRGVTGRFHDDRGRASGYRIVVRARMTVVAAGAIHTPALLKSAGLGGSRHLGRNLSVHPASKVYAEMNEDVFGWEGIPQAYSFDQFHEEGILFEGIFVPPDVGATMNLLGGAKLHEFMRSYRRMAAFGFMIEDHGRGSVINLPWLGPVIRYSLTQKDAELIKRATLFLAGLFLRHGAKRVIPMIRGPVAEIRSEADLSLLERTAVKPSSVEVAAFHPLGTARIGNTADQGVVDEDGRLFGWDGIHISDGSIMPTPLGVNPQLTIMALAHRMAAHLSEVLGGRLP